jgi:beta-xylosidase
VPNFRACLALAASALALAPPASAQRSSGGADKPFVPTYEANFPDPFILPVEGRYIAYATNDGGRNVPMAVSRDLVRWEALNGPDGKARDAMPVLPPWAKAGKTWAPEVLKVQGGYILYFTARHAKSDWQCIGVATSSDPLGPFTSNAAEPLVCQMDRGGTIDATPFRDADGQLYLYYKNDGNRIRKPTELFAQRLSADGLRTSGEPVALLRNDAAWEGNVVESPTMVRRGGGYTMLFSANDFFWSDKSRLSPYAIGCALCDGPMGPCKDAPDNPLLYSYSDPKMGCLSGPGHQTIFNAGGRSFIAFHAWQATPGCRRLDEKRFMYIAPLGWDAAGKPQIGRSLRPAKGK